MKIMSHTQCHRSAERARVRKKQARKNEDLILLCQVCLACLLPLFLVPIANALPLLFDFIMAKVYRLFGWEYRKPERAPPACPYKPVARKDNKVEEQATLPHSITPTVGLDDKKQD
uniref:Uncharacterized protein n=1 Tax=Nelumbo nucifera TaxID=4432 RepID=A0A822YBX7_NELNU|nr:TPA_asm: hypothetical protein HUJ06_030044 [Nelumbo nucifera]